MGENVGETPPLALRSRLEVVGSEDRHNLPLQLFSTLAPSLRLLLDAARFIFPVPRFGL